MSASTAIADEIIYPETDGKPMGDNTLQINWMIFLFGNLEDLFKKDPDVFVACNLNWYPIKGNNKKVTAPDVFVAFERPKGRRSSYKQWREAGVPPTVVFEILAPGNTEKELEEKFDFYERFGVEEYYIYDPDMNNLQGFQRKRNRLAPIREMNGWVSPRLQIRFDHLDDNLLLWMPDKTPFLSRDELAQSRQEAILQAEAERKQARAERKKAEAERKKAEAERKKAEAERKKADEERKRADEERKRADEERKRADEERKRADDQQKQADEERKRADDQQKQADEERKRADDQQKQADEERKRADEERKRADEERRAKEALLTKLKSRGIDTDTL